MGGRQRMGGSESSRDSSLRSTDNPQTPADEASSSSTVTGGGLDQQPIQLLVLLHRAIGTELAKLKLQCLVIAGVEENTRQDCSVVDLRKRFEFLNQVYIYHCTAEDEVFFVALDARVKNIACTYCLEHQSIDDIFQSIFCNLNLVLEKDGSTSEKFQELVFSVGVLEKTMCRHMAKEEEQVFPLLMKHFTDNEQTSLVWQFICSVPVTFLVDLFPWLSCSLSAEEQVVLMQCIREVVPNDRVLQELVISWLDVEKKQSSAANVQYGDLAQCPDEPESVIGIWQSLEVSSAEHSQHTQERCLQTNVEGGPINGLQLWHTVLLHDLKEILEELYNMKKSSKYSSLNLVVVRAKFLADVLFFYSNLLDKIIYPLMDDMSGVPASYEPFLHKHEAQSLQLMLYNDSETSVSMLMFVEKLCNKMEPFIVGVREYFFFYESEVFPLITKKSNHEAQKKILFTSLHMMPLGLLKCVTTWFSSQLPKDKLKSVLESISQSAYLDSNFASLLHEWIRLGYSGKTSVEDLQDMFKSNTSYLSKQMKDEQHCKTPNETLLTPCSSITKNETPLDSLISSVTLPPNHVVVYSGDINIRLFFPPISSFSDPLLECPVINSINSLEPKPMDHIYYFHKALKKELENIVIASNQVGENFELLMDFRRRFNVMQSLYQLHSDAEDKIAFPALEAKKKIQNISLSFSIDHRLDVEHFNLLSDIMDEMSTLCQVAHGVCVDSRDPEMLRYRQLSLRLQDGCRSLQKILVDHIKHEELEVWPLFRDNFSIEEQEWIIGGMLGRTGAEALQELILWLLAFLTQEEQHAIMSFWRKAAKDTMFDEWLGEWWEGMTENKSVKLPEESDSSSSKMEDIMEIVSKYLFAEDSYGGGNAFDSSGTVLQADSDFSKVDDEAKWLVEKHGNIEHEKLSRGNKHDIVVDTAVSTHKHLQPQKQWHMKKLLALSQGEMEAIIRRISRDSSLDQEKQTRVIQCLMSSRWAVVQQQSVTKDAILHDTDKLQGQFPSYRDDEESIFGCIHYKTNCKLVAPCCNQIFTCRRCHDDASDHVVDRKLITQMMCMKCLVIQPVGPSCTTPACDNFSMSRHYCRICKLFDDDRDIYHCPFCNICRLGKGLGIGYFHCMRCNACMSRYLSVHTCRQKCFEDVCPICHEDFFTSCIPVKALNCGHMMHSTCFEDYTSVQYICPVCSKSLGDMQAYFAVLDALLAEETLPEEYRDQTQAILCNDCGSKGIAPFHWVHHKCSFCGSYNTRLL